MAKCECSARMNEKLAAHNGKLAVALALTDNMSRMIARPVVATEKLDAKKRKPVPTVMASSFCPVLRHRIDLRDTLDDAGEK